jgi:hypothetical protein
LPYLEENAIHAAYNKMLRVDDTNNARAMRTPIDVYACPSRRRAAADRNFDNDDQALWSSLPRHWAITPRTQATKPIRAPKETTLPEDKSTRQKPVPSLPAPDSPPGISQMACPARWRLASAIFDLFRRVRLS